MATKYLPEITLDQETALLYSMTMYNVIQTYAVNHFKFNRYSSDYILMLIDPAFTKHIYCPCYMLTNLRKDEYRFANSFPNFIWTMTYPLASCE